MLHSRSNKGRSTIVFVVNRYPSRFMRWEIHPNETNPRIPRTNVLFQNELFKCIEFHKLSSSYFYASFLSDKLLNKITIFDSILLNSSNKYSRHPPPSFYDFLNHFLQLIDAISTSTWSTRSFFAWIGRKKSKQNTIRSLSREIHGKAPRQKARIEFLPVRSAASTSSSPSSPLILYVALMFHSTTRTLGKVY